MKEPHAAPEPWVADPWSRRPCYNCLLLLITISTVAIGKPEWHARKASHCGSKQQQRSRAAITLLLLVRATYIRVLFFAHIPFVMNHTFNVTPA